MPRYFKNQKPINRNNFCRWFENKNLIANGELELGAGNNFTNWNKTIPTHSNLITQSSDFSNPYWTKNTGVTVTPNSVISPKGTLTADKIIYDGSGGGGGFRIYCTVLSTSVLNQAYNTNIWIKSISNITLRIGNNFGISTINVTTSWQRFDLSAIGDGIKALQLLIYSNTGNNSPFEIHLSSAQCDLGLIPTENIETSGTVLTVDDGTIIPATRTNYINYSKQLSNGSAWVTSNLNIIDNSEVGYKGTLTASRLVATSTTMIQFRKSLFPLSSNLPLTLSVYFKKGNVSNVMNRFGFYNNSSSTALYFIYVNYDTLQITETPNNANGTSSIESIGNSWYRLKMTINSGFTSGQNLEAYFGGLGGGLIGQAIGDYIILEDPQVEGGIFATDAINTGATAVTVNDGLNASRAVRLNRGVTPTMAFNYNAVFTSPNKYKISFWAKTASASTTLRLASDVSTFTEFNITHRDFIKYSFEVNTVVGDSQLRFFNQLANSSLIIDNVTVDLVETGSGYEIPNPYPLDNDNRYFPVLAHNDKFRFYINSDAALTGLTFANLRLALYNEQDIQMFQNANINSIAVSGGITIYSTDMTLNLSAYPEGRYYWAIIDVVAGTIKYTSNYFSLIHNGYEDYTCHVEYRHYKNIFKFIYESTMSSFSNKIRIHLLMLDEIPGGDVEQYQEVSTGSFRNYNRIDEKIIKCETYYFDREAHQAMDVLSKHSDLTINTRKYLCKGTYSFNTEPISKVSKGELELLDQEYSQINN